MTCEDSYDEAGTAQSLTHATKVPVTVRVVDVNDNVPVFSQEIYNVDVVGRVYHVEANTGCNFQVIENCGICIGKLNKI